MKQEKYLASGAYRFSKIISNNLHIPAKVSLALTWPYVALLGDLYLKQCREKRRNILKKEKQINLALVTIAKNEGAYIEEWCAYHKAIGVDKIYLYDNESNDDMIQRIKPFIQEGFVEVNVIKGRKQQLNANNDALNRYGGLCRYMAFIDCDEFLTPIGGGGGRKSCH